MKNILIISQDEIFARGTQIILENGTFGADISPSIPSDIFKYDALLTDIPSLASKKLPLPLIVADYEAQNCESFLLRPFSDKELLEICSFACNNGSESSPDKFILNEKQKLICFGKSSLPLTAREFELLSLLMSVPRRAVSREEILTEVFGGSGAGNVDAVYVNYLRKKLVALSGKNPIISVRGYGYEFKD